MNKAGLADIIAWQTGCSKAAAERSINEVILGVKESLREGGSLTLAGFGNFEIRNRKQRNGTHPRTQQPIVIGPKKTVVFRPSDRFLKK